MMVYVLVKFYIQKLTLFEYLIRMILLLAKPDRTFDISQETHKRSVIQPLKIMKIAPVKTLQSTYL